MKNTNKKTDESTLVSIRFYRTADYQNFKRLCDEKNVSMTLAVNGLAKQAINENRLPVEV